MSLLFKPNFDALFCNLAKRDLASFLVSNSAISQFLFAQMVPYGYFLYNGFLPSVQTLSYLRVLAPPLYSFFSGDTIRDVLLLVPTCMFVGLDFEAWPRILNF